MGGGTHYRLEALSDELNLKRYWLITTANPSLFGMESRTQLTCLMILFGPLDRDPDDIELH